MKKISFWVFILGILTCAGFTSCGDDDDDENKGNGSVKSCKSVIDGRSTEYKYAYLFLYHEAHNGKYGYELNFSSFDIFYYLKNQDKISDNIMGSMFMLDFESSMAPNGINMPVGEYASESFGCEVELDIPISHFIGENVDEDYPGSIWYGKEDDGASSPLKLSKTSDGMYKIEITEMKLKASKPGEGHIGSDAREVSGTFSFVGIPELKTDSDVNDYVRGVTASDSPLKSHKRLVMKLERK